MVYDSTAVLLMVVEVLVMMMRGYNSNANVHTDNANEAHHIDDDKDDNDTFFHEQHNLLASEAMAEPTGERHEQKPFRAALTRPGLPHVATRCPKQTAPPTDPRPRTSRHPG